MSQCTRSTTPTDLYRFYDKHGRLLYVGISLSAIQRAAQHRRRSGWWWEVQRMEVERFATRKLAVAAERRAIRNEHPKHNIVGVTTEPRVTAIEPDGSFVLCFAGQRQRYRFGLADGPAV